MSRHRDLSEYFLYKMFSTEKILKQLTQKNQSDILVDSCDKAYIVQQFFLSSWRIFLLQLFCFVPHSANALCSTELNRKI